VRTKHVLIISISVILIEGCTVLPFFRERPDFIKVKGTHFEKDGRPYYYAGTNMWYACYLGSPGETGDRQRLQRELDFLKANGLVNLRILAASEDSYIRRSVKPALQQSPGILDSSLLIGLDYLLAELAERGMHAVLYLNNYWEWSGGMSQYNVWADGGEGVDPEDTSKWWGAFMEFSATFYSNEKANALYRDYVTKIITRKNTITGRYYFEDPTIMAWQLANEPRPGPDSPESARNLPAFYRWLDKTAAYIHSLDSNHLVSTGSEGLAGCLQSEEYFLVSHASPHIDYLTFHLWPMNWGWFDPTKIAATQPITEVKAINYINKHILLARQLQRPIVLEEFGLDRDSGRIAIGTPTTARDRYYNLVCSVLLDSSRAGSPIAGSNFWAWGGEGGGNNPDGMWRFGDPFLGDPPHEPQGRNSIFITDTSTMIIVRSHAFKMMRLGLIDTLTAQR
jgi:mannan endo-1,4-beta-mannosidase